MLFQSLGTLTQCSGVIGNLINEPNRVQKKKWKMVRSGRAERKRFGSNPNISADFRPLSKGSLRGICGWIEFLFKKEVV